VVLAASVISKSGRGTCCKHHFVALFFSFGSELLGLLHNMQSTYLLHNMQSIYFVQGITDKKRKMGQLQQSREWLEFNT
jgi:hypothetical protein